LLLIINPAVYSSLTLASVVPSQEPYDDTADEERGSNTLISLDEQFEDIQIATIGEHRPTHGFSSFQFLPFRENEVVALKTEEYQGKIATCMPHYGV